jgi:hypothetical protein
MRSISWRGAVVIGGLAILPVQRAAARVLERTPMMPVEQSVQLVRHPSIAADGVRSITARVSRSPDGELKLAFRLVGELDRIRIPSPTASAMGHDLWKHTCFEAFIGVADATAYHELNFSPSRQWAAYAFRAYRDGGPLQDDTLAPQITVQVLPDGLEVDARVRLDRLSAAYPSTPLRVGLSAVIEHRDGTMSYWALRHPQGKPDFHHPDSFALRLPPVSATP